MNKKKLEMINGGIRCLDSNSYIKYFNGLMNFKIFCSNNGRFFLSYDIYFLAFYKKKAINKIR